MTTWWWEDDEDLPVISPPDLTVDFTPTEPDYLWTPNGEHAVWPSFGFGRFLVER